MTAEKGISQCLKYTRREEVNHAIFMPDSSEIDSLVPSRKHEQFDSLIEYDM